MGRPKFALVGIPKGLRFEALNLSTNADTGEMEFDWGPIRSILDANALTLDHNDEAVEIISAWYELLRAEGFRDAAAERHLGRHDEEPEDMYGMERILPGSALLQ